jgi:hypothetical protein
MVPAEHLILDAPGPGLSFRTRILQYAAPPAARISLLVSQSSEVWSRFLSFHVAASRRKERWSPRSPSRGFAEWTDRGQSAAVVQDWYMQLVQDSDGISGKAGGAERPSPER